MEEGHLTTQEARRGRRGTAVCAVITIVNEEFAPAQRLLGTTSWVAESPYYTTADRGDGSFDVVLAQAADRSNGPAQEITRSIIEDYRPAYLFLVGIAGGVINEKGEPRDKIGLGDVVVGDYVDYSEFRKLAGGKNALRRIAYDHPSHALRTKFMRPMAIQDKWHECMTVTRPDKTTRAPRAQEANVLAGEKLLGDPKNAYQIEILKEFDKATAIDMESYGFARAVFEARWSIHYNPQCAVVRGISDYANGEGNDEVRGEWRDYAAEAAVAFVASTIRQILGAK